MAIIGKIRKHSGLAVIIVGVAIAAFVIGDFGKKRSRGTNNVGTVEGDPITYLDFNTKVEEALDTYKKQNPGNDKITDAQTYSARESTWNQMVKEIVLQDEYDKLGLVVSPEELFDQVQGRNPHRYILQYFKDPKTGIYDPAMVLNYLKNLDKMEPKAKTEWLQFEKAIKEDRAETKLSNLFAKAYYVPKAFLKNNFINDTRTLKVRFVGPPLTEIQDNAVKLTDADYQKFYDDNKAFFKVDQAGRDLDYVSFDVLPSDIDKKKIAEDVAQVFTDFQASADLPNFINANSDKKYDSNYVKKGTLPGPVDSLAFLAAKGAIIPPVEFNSNWYMGKVQNMEDRPDSVKASMILITWADTHVSQTVKRTKDEAKKLADSVVVALKKSPEKFNELVRNLSDYPTGKDEGGDLKWIVDGNSNFQLLFDKGFDMKVNDLKIVETGIGYAVLKLTDKTKPMKKVRIALLQRAIVPSNQTFQDTYLKASAFAGQYKTPEAFDKAAQEKGVPKRSATGVKEMDNYVMGLPSAREIVRWAYGENTKVGEVSPVFDLTGKYVIAILKDSYDKGYIPLEKVKSRIEQNVKNQKKVDLLAEKMNASFQTNKNLNALAASFNTKVDTTEITFSGYNRSNLGREYNLIGKLFTEKKGELLPPMAGKYGAYFVIIDDVIESPPKEDFTYERGQMVQAFSGRAVGGLYNIMEKLANVEDNRAKFY
jgi:peptidyl-prolyl cis-trans isomerase D